MNKKLIISLMTLICSVFSFSACSDDDDDKKVSYAGTYQGELSVDMGVADPTVSEQSIAISKIEGGYQLQLANFSIGEIEVETIKVPVSITDAGAVTGNGEDIPVFLTVTADVTIIGTIIDGTADLTINVSAPLAPGQDPIKMTVKFNGTKQ